MQRLLLRKNLFDLANSQYGYFTAAQAKSVGVKDELHSYYVKNGAWIHCLRGIYRLRDFPASDYENYNMWYLWSFDRHQIPQGVLSHQTALSIYELSDIMPPKVHMTVPAHFKRYTPVPAALVLHRANLQKQHTLEMHGFRVTTVLKTLLDMVQTQNISTDILIQAAQQAYQRNYVRKEEFQTNPGLAFLLPFMTFNHS